MTPAYGAYGATPFNSIKAPSRQIVPHEYINPDPLLRLDKWPVIRLGDQHTHRTSHFMAGVLVDDGVDAAADQGAS